MRKRLKWVYVLLGIIILFSQIFYLRYWYNKTLDEIGFNALIITRTVAQNIDLDQYEKIVSTKEKNDYYSEMQAFFKRVQENTGVKYLYVEHQVSPDEIEYIFDAEKDSLGNREENSTPEAHKRLDSMHTRIQTFALYGSLISGYTPLVKNGKVIGVVGADVDVQYFYGELRSRIIGIGFYALLMITVFSLLIYLNFKEEINIRRSSENRLRRIMNSLKNLLDNAGQGFLRFGNNLTLDQEFSKECYRLFEADPGGKDFPTLLYPSDPDQREFLTNLLQEILGEKDQERREIYLTLLPIEVLLNSRLLSLEFRLVKDPHRDEDAFLVILTDKTERKILEDQMDEERQTLNMIVHAVTKKEELLECILDYKRFKDYAYQLIETTTSIQEILSELYRSVHTFKGTFGQFEMRNLVNALHDLETQLSSLMTHSPLTRLELLEFLDHCPFLEWLDQDLLILQNSLGTHFLKRKTLSVDEEKLSSLEQKVLHLVPKETAQELLSDLAQLRYRPFSDLLLGYSNHVKHLASRLNKQIHPLILTGDEILVNPTYYLSFTRSLVHIFRNAVDHGIEAPEDRLELGKNEHGQITCLIERTTKDTFILRIEDDGQGMESSILNQIFNAGFSTKSEITDLSGRGIGLPVVQIELEKLGGVLHVQSTPGVGTTFEFTLPTK